MVAGSFSLHLLRLPAGRLGGWGSRVVGDVHYGSLGTERFCKACRSPKTLSKLASAALLRIVPKDRTRMSAGQKMGGYQNTK